MTEVYYPTLDEKLKMIDNMKKHGGSFVVALSEVFLRADSTNYRKLCETFAKYVSLYLNW